MEQAKKIPGDDRELFFTRVSSLPMVAEAVGRLFTLYTRTKERNGLIKYTFETAESGAKMALASAQPFLNRLGKPSKFYPIHMYHNYLKYNV